MSQFYVGSVNVSSPYVKKTEKEAIEHAKELVAEDGMRRPVVKIVAWVEEVKPVRVRRVR